MEKERKQHIEDKYKSIVDSSPMGMHFYKLQPNHDLIFSGFNPAADKILKISHEVFLGKTIEDAFPNLATTKIPGIYKEIAEKGTSFKDEQILYKDQHIEGAYEVFAFQTGPGEMVAMFNDITDKIRDREENKQQHKFLKTILDGSPYPVFYKNKQGIFLYCSKTYCKLFGVNEDAIVGHEFKDFCKDPAVIEISDQTDQKVLNSLQNVAFQATIKRPDGVVFEMMITKLPYFNTGNEVSGILGFLVDITPLKEIELNLKRKNDESLSLNEELTSTEEELRVVNEDLYELNRKLEQQNRELLELNETIQLSEKKFRAAFFTSPDSINLNRLQDGLYIEVNEGYTRITGYTPEDVKGKTSAEINIWVNPDDRKKLVSALMEKGYCDNLEAQFKMKDGRIKTGIMSARILELNGERVILSITRDIEIQKKAEKALKEGEERFRQLAENTNDIFWLREGSEILYINSAFERIWGRSREEVLDNPDILLQWIHPEDKDSFKVLAELENVNTFEAFSEQYRIIKPDGSVRWIWSRTYPVFNEEGIPYRIAGIATDITEQKEIEKELISTREKALESDRLKSAFLANISHEIRTPMNGIIGFSELLDNEDLDADKRRMYIDIIRSSGHQLIRIIDDIIDISKIEANQLTLNPALSNINQLLRELDELFQREKLAKNKENIAIKTHFPLPDEEVVVNTDESRLRQVLINLLNNALKFTEEGEIFFGYEKSERFLTFKVSDTGIGISEEHKSQIFKRFRQGSESMNRKYGGTGLGLAISEGIAHLLGGKIWFESETGKGSNFYFTLPYRNEKATSAKKVTSVPMAIVGEWQGLKILIAEDDEINYLFLRNILEPTGARLFHARDGEEAVRFCRENPDLTVVLMDIRMPNMNGYEATRQIRSLRKDLPIIAQTAYAMPEDQIKAIQAGCNGYISKPISRKGLMELLGSYVTI